MQISSQLALAVGMCMKRDRLIVGGGRLYYTKNMFRLTIARLLLRSRALKERNHVIMQLVHFVWFICGKSSL